MAKLAQVHRAKHMFDIETLEVKQPFYIQSITICIFQVYGPTRPLQEITTLRVRLLNDGVVGAYYIRKQKQCKKSPKTEKTQ